MAQEDSTPAANGSDPNADGPQAATLAQYIKDLSAESPSAPMVFQWQEQPSVDVGFNLNVDSVAEEVREVTLKIEVKAQSQSGVHFLVDLTFCGLFGLRNFPQEAMPPFLLVEAPRLLFPFARQIICDAIQNMGFAPLLLEPIDFGGAYLAQMEAQQGQVSGTPASDDAPGETPGNA